MQIEAVQVGLTRPAGGEGGLDLAIQILVCDRCGGPRRILGAVTEPHAIRRMLAALGLAAEPPPGRPVPAA